ncbi:ATP-grasp domain-containing protein [Candidatus Hecatella orcuttiae]|uniref:ATP-grasp domain-containing protein n=1 Tax=Candidatus Hecatella orcuttiae TaxID=1935119 RepID=UPI0028682E10|nr:ATP-grasp domain-containing protein [Candidatus Hecatella orcuttiae]
MKVFVFEYAAGGGFAGEVIPSEILCDGYGMFKAFISDLKSLGCQVAVTLDRRLKTARSLLRVDEAVFIQSPQELNFAVRKLSAAADAALVIAPETRNALGEAVETMEEGGCQSLNCPSGTVKKFQRKSAVYEVLRKAGVKVPKTVKAKVQDGCKGLEKAVEAVGFPAVVKPDQEAGCTGLSLIHRKEDVASALEKTVKEAHASLLLVQEYLKGASASVSLLCSGKDLKPLSLNKQWITLGRPSSASHYLGGFTPYAPPLKEAALKEAVKAARALAPLRGYVGVDLVLTPHGPVVVDINLRLTASYLGVRKILEENPAALLLGSAFHGRLPEKIFSKGSAVYKKVQLPQTRVRGSAEFFLPPRWQPEAREGYLVAHGSTFSEASQRLRRVLDKIFKAEHPPIGS